MNNKKENTLYLCDANKNIHCKKLSCYINGDPCKQTTERKFAKKGNS